MLNRKIIHIDMDCFYAAIEIRDNPELINKPVAVGGNSER
ncbi:MAG: dinB, partial [Burkholderiales bacterium]|nr:dinB [Burkholderiales bacterium]